MLGSGALDRLLAEALSLLLFGSGWLMLVSRMFLKAFFVAVPFLFANIIYAHILRTISEFKPCFVQVFSLVAASCTCKFFPFWVDCWTESSAI